MAKFVISIVISSTVMEIRDWHMHCLNYTVSTFM
jgi:hypothetical protein